MRFLRNGAGWSAVESDGLARVALLTIGNIPIRNNEYIKMRFSIPSAKFTFHNNSIGFNWFVESSQPERFCGKGQRRSGKLRFCASNYSDYVHRHVQLWPGTSSTKFISQKLRNCVGTATHRPVRSLLRRKGHRDAWKLSNWTLSTIPDRDSGSGSHENVALSVSNQVLIWQWPIRVEFISLKLREERGARKGRRRWSWSWSQSSTWLAKESEANATYSYGWTIQFIHQNRMGFDWKSWNAAAATVVDSPHLRFPPLFLYLGYFIS